MKRTRSIWYVVVISTLLTLTAVTALPQAVKKAYPVRVPQGEKVKIQGVVSHRSNDMFTVRDPGGAETTVVLTSSTKVSSHNRGIRGKKSYPETYIMRGLRVQSEGRGDGNGYLLADWVRFDEQDLRAAQALEQTNELAEENAARVAAAEEEARKLAAQIEETDALAQAANAKANEAAEAAAAAQATANQAFKDAAMANARINGLDDYDLIKTIPVLFRTGSSTLTKTAKVGLDEAAEWARAEKAKGNTNGWLVQVVGFADTSGKSAKNKALSDRRAKTVIDYLVLKYDIDLRRLVQPFGYGEGKPIASNKTAAGRAQNRRVEVRILQNKGIANKLGGNP
ncbi:MAG TPA: OmpA family protein [Pyrinomonadaceae bacterium]|nr:OmpA family protein [Pyrinomonadaceae bacterium]